MRGTRIALAAALAAGAVSLIAGAGTASAACSDDPYAECHDLAPFDHAVLDIPGNRYGEVISPTSDPLLVTVTQMSPTTFAIQPDDWHFPQISFTSPVQGTIKVDLGGTATGTFDPATGAASFQTPDLIATLSLVGQPCEIHSGPLTFSTAGTLPLAGVPFSPASVPMSGNGAITASWPTLPNGTGPGCGLVDNLTKGQGGLWISRGITPVIPTGPAALDVDAKPNKKKVEEGKKAKFTATVSNTGESSAEGVKVCAKVKGLKVKPKCHDVGSLAAGADAAEKFKVKTGNKDEGKYKVKFTASGTGLENATDTSKLKVTD